MPDIRLEKYPEIVLDPKKTDRARTFRDPGLFEVGGTITLEPGQRTRVPRPVFHRLIGSPYLTSADVYDRRVAAEAALAQAQEDLAEAEEAVEAEDDKRPRGRPKKGK